MVPATRLHRARMLTVVRQDVQVVDGMFGLVDEECAGEGVPDPRPGDHRVRTGPGAVYLETRDSLVIQARLRVEVWDGPTEIDATYWPDQVSVWLDLPTARLFVDGSDAGAEAGPHLPSPGRWRLRVGRREAPDDLPWDAEADELVGACFLLQFRPEDP